MYRDIFEIAEKKMSTIFVRHALENNYHNNNTKTQIIIGIDEFFSNNLI